MSAKPTLYSGRFNPFLDEFGADSILGPPPTQTKIPTDEPVTEAQVPPEHDLVGRLIEENQDIWTELLNNKFCKEMKETGNDDQNFLRGFEWYMKQDYFYVANLVQLEASYVPKAKTAKDLGTVLKRIPHVVKSVEDLFATLTTTQPNGLGIDPSTVLGTQLSDVLKKYIDLVNSTAEKENLVLSQVALIGGLQSYDLIAADLHINSTHRDTPWYKLWVEVNFAYERSGRRQRQYFIDNYESWKDHMPEIKRLFRETCQAELDLWNEAMNHSRPPMEKPEE